MQGLGFFVAFFVLLIVLALSTNEGGVFGSATSTPSQGTTQTITSRNETITRVAAPKETPKLSNEEIEKRVAKIYKELDTLREDLREAKLREPTSSFATMADLRIGNARTTDPEREYLTLRANSRNTTPVPISDWYLESYVTKERAALPDGARILDRFRTQYTAPISLEPGETAYLLTAETPFNVSFHENLCTGYLVQFEDVYPSLQRRCPLAKDEMIRYANIDLDNDACYDFVEDIHRCEIIDEDIINDADVSGACRQFVADNLDYDNCVSNHRYDPFFDNVGTWRIYLDRDEELWRKEREIIRLMDGNDRVIDVIEY